MTERSRPTRRKVIAASAAAGGLASAARAAPVPALPPLTIAAQGSYAAGGTVYDAPGTFDPHAFFSDAGGRNHGDHAYVRFQRPVKPRRLPLVLWHGGGQFMKTWESTPDGREGYDSLLLRRDWEVHLVDQPRRGGAGHANSPGAIETLRPIDKSLWHVFRLGVYPDFFPGVQFPRDPAAIDQYWRQRTDDTGPEDQEVVVAGVSAVFDRIGRGVLITHSNSGKWGFVTAARNPNVRAVISYEPGTIVVPEGYQPRPVASNDPLIQRITQPVAIPDAQFANLARIPIQMVFGDNIPAAPSPYAGLDFWRIVLARAEEFRDLVNARGGDVTILELPKAGIAGNTHFPFSDLNNLAVADKLSEYLHSRKLDA